MLYNKSRSPGQSDSSPLKAENQTSTLFLILRLALYIASSACLISSAALAASSGKQATPAETVILPPGISS